METNFSFLESKKEYELFAGACIDAECILESSPVMSAVASRKALELGVKWVYSIDSALKLGIGKVYSLCCTIMGFHR